ncbi:hypothetical protein ACUY1T_14845 [Billgrantia sp. Q4P2]
MARDFDTALCGFDDLRPGQGVERISKTGAVAWLPKTSNWMLDHD